MCRDVDTDKPVPWGFEKFTATYFQAVFPGQLQVCICVSSGEAMEFRYAQSGYKQAKVLSLLCTCGESSLEKTLSLGSLCCFC